MYDLTKQVPDPTLISQKLPMSILAETVRLLSVACDYFEHVNNKKYTLYILTCFIFFTCFF